MVADAASTACATHGLRVTSDALAARLGLKRLITVYEYVEGTGGCYIVGVLLVYIQLSSESVFNML